MALIQLGETKNFIVKYEANLGGVARDRAQALLETVETDFQHLKYLFALPNIYADADFPHNRHKITLVVDNPNLPDAPEALGSNNGYSETGKTQITIDPGAAIVDPTLGAEMVRMLFVAEVTEVLANFPVDFSCWKSGNSFREGLSRVMAAHFHPVGYYNTGLGPGVNN